MNVAHHVFDMLQSSQALADEVSELYQLMKKSMEIKKQVHVVRDLQDVTGYLDKDAKFSTELIFHLPDIEINW